MTEEQKKVFVVLTYTAHLPSLIPTREMNGLVSIAMGVLTVIGVTRERIFPEYRLVHAKKEAS